MPEIGVVAAVLTRTVTSPNQPVEVVKYSVGVVQFYLNSNNQVTGTTQSLPGGVSVTDANSTSTTTFTSLHGNAGLTVSAAGTTRTRFDPFGTPLTALPDTLPGSAEAGFGTVAGKLTDTLSAFGLIEMGARLYSTVLGRFLQVDPVPGGGVNAFSYPPDPVNMNDYSGMVGTADSYSSWRGRGVKTTWDTRGVSRSTSRESPSNKNGSVLEDRGLDVAISIINLGCDFAAFATKNPYAIGAAFAVGSVQILRICERDWGSVECQMAALTLGASGSFAVLRRYEQIDESVVNFMEIGLLNISGVGTFSSIGRFLGTWGTD